MNTALMILLMYCTLLGADIQDPTPVATVEQGVTELNEMFPDWRESYELGEFDCSEMSAFVKTYFEYQGFNAELYRGRSRHTGLSHAWVVVDGKVIECTKLKIRERTGSYDKRTPRTITENHKQYMRDVDWWNSAYIRKYAGPGFTSMILSEADFYSHYDYSTLAYANDVMK